MAEFGIKATNLQDPQAAGSRPIQPVQGPADFTPDLGGLGGLFQGLVSKTKQEDPWIPVLNRYIKDRDVIQQAQSTGEMDNARAKIEREKLYAKYAAEGATTGFPIAYQQQLSQAAGYLDAGTGTSAQDKLVVMEQEAAQKRFDDLQSSGLMPPGVTYQNLTPEQKREIDNTWQAFRNAEANAKRNLEDEANQRARNSELRAQGQFEQTNTDWLRKEQARREVGGVIGGAYKLFDANVSALMNNPDMTPEQRLASLKGFTTGFKSNAYQLLQGDQQAYQNTIAVIDDLEKLGEKLIDPATRSKSLQDEFNARIAATQLMMTEDPSIRWAASGAKLFPNSQPLQLMAAKAGMKLFNMEMMAVDEGRPLPSVLTGDISAQRLTLDSTREAVRRLNAGQVSDPQGTKDAAAKSFQSTVKALGQFQAGSQNTMEYVMEAVASPEYAVMVKEGLTNPRDNAQALQKVSDLYVDAFNSTLRQGLTAPMGDTRYEAGVPSTNNAALLNIIDFKVDSSGKISIEKVIAPEYRKEISASDVYLDRQVSTFRQSVEPRLNQLVRAVAHLEGSTDYKEVFERMAPHLLQGFYAPNEQFLEEQKAKGYIGTGNINNPANWRGKSGFPSEQTD